MAKPEQFILVMVSTVAILTQVSGTAVQYVCPGDSVQIFEDIDYDRCNAVISLNMNGKRNVQIASWSFKNCTLNATVLNEYKNRVFRDQNGTITISKLHQFDHRKYVVKAETVTSVSIKEVEMYVMEAPNKNCKPKIERFGNTLHGALPSVGCGNPVTTLYWRNVDDDFPDTREPVLQIVPGKETRAYYACIEGQARRCALSLTPLDYCSTYVIEGNNRGTEPNNTPLVIVSVTSAVVIILLVFVVLGIMCMKLSTKNITVIADKRKASGKSVPKNQCMNDLDIESVLLELSQIGARTERVNLMHITD